MNPHKDVETSLKNRQNFALANSVLTEEINSQRILFLSRKAKKIEYRIEVNERKSVNKKNLVFKWLSYF